jgi:hypothetical protein
MGDGTGALNYEQALAETDRLLGEVAAADDLLSQYRAYLQERSARAGVFGSADGLTLGTLDFRASEMRESPCPSFSLGKLSTGGARTPRRWQAS